MEKLFQFREGWKCDEYSNLDSEDPLLWCSGYEHMRENLDLENEKDLSKYLHKIYLKRCSKMDDNTIFLFLAQKGCTAPVDHLLGEGDYAWHG